MVTMTYVLMKVLESRPKRYDLGIKLLTWGRVGKYHDYMASHVRKNQHVLDLGCGTGSLTIKLARMGAIVVGIDRNPDMSDIARVKIKNEQLEDRVELLPLNVLDLDELGTSQFDVITASLLFSELSENERKYLLQLVKNALKSGGLLIIGDETTPRNPLKRILNALIRIPLVIITYLLTQATTNPVKNLEQLLTDAGFDIVARKENWLGNFTIWLARKPRTGAEP